MTIITGDCRKVLAEHGPSDMILADPPYGDTKLPWDKFVRAAGSRSPVRSSRPPARCGFSARCASS